jgi:DNA/RNA-binding domain of Phe-tRNA-synthetase-like protein
VYFQHSPAIWAGFPDLGPVAVLVEAVTPDADVSAPVARFEAAATARLAGGTESELPEIRAWRRAFAQLGLKPTQYRCAAESLLRRFRKEGSLPRIHPLIDLCNAISLARAVPVAVFDTAQVAGGLEVRAATGEETYLTFGGDTERPAPGEVIFADQAGQAHARRWCNRQSATSAVRDGTAGALIVAEALHPGAAAAAGELAGLLATELAAVWSVPGPPAILTPQAPRLDF